MNTGQTMLTLAALTVLSILTLNYYNSIAVSGRNINQSNAGFFATSLATSYVERAQNLPFDAVTDTLKEDSIIADPTVLTLPVNFGRGGDATKDSIQNFTDFDDFDGFVDTTKPGGMLGTFVATFNVFYVVPSNMDSVSNKQTFVKRMDIRVWRVYPPVDTTEGVAFDTARVSCIMGYFKFQ
jgi:hypothetical protein